VEPGGGMEAAALCLLALCYRLCSLLDLELLFDESELVSAGKSEMSVKQMNVTTVDPAGGPCRRKCGQALLGFHNGATKTLVSSGRCRSPRKERLLKNMMCSETISHKILRAI
jgi:hypothetical protein